MGSLIRAMRMLAVVVAALAAVAASGQPAPGMHRIAFVNVGDAAPNAVNAAAFRRGLADLGYVEGRNIEIDFAWGGQNESAMPRIAGEALRRKPEIVVSTGGPVTIRAVKAATASVPVVFITGDPLAEGLIDSYAKPGHNLTGLAVLAGDLDAKRLELLTQISPNAKRIAMIWNPAQQRIDEIVRNVDAAAARLHVTLLRYPARDRKELSATLAAISGTRPDALLVVADPMLGFEREQIVAFARAQRLPGVYFWREFAELGGLATYGTNLASVYRRAATYVDRILKGAKPGDLPVEQPTTFDLVVNRSAARELGITIPPVVLQRADIVLP